MKLIDKDAVVAEIERIKKNEGWCQVGKDTADVYYARGFRFACEHIISFLDTLEVKEVDLDTEKSIDESIIRKIVNLEDEAVKHYDSIIKKEDEENGFSQLAIDLFECNVEPKELCIQYIVEKLKAQKGE